jgi:Zn-dependent M28 family amino/carboxypeptidase
MRVHGEADERRRIRNVCATVIGRTDPDEMVLISNHYDAWSNGALDPNSGTVVTLEFARAFMQIGKLMPRLCAHVCGYSELNRLASPSHDHYM